MQFQSILMTLKLVLNTQMIWMIFRNKLKNTIQKRNVKYELLMMIWLFTYLLIKTYSRSDWILHQRLKTKISLVFITQSYFAVPKNINLNLQILDYLHKKYIAKPYSLQVIDTTFASDDPSRFRGNLLEKV